MSTPFNFLGLDFGDAAASFLKTVQQAPTDAARQAAERLVQRPPPPPPPPPPPTRPTIHVPAKGQDISVVNGVIVGSAVLLLAGGVVALLKR